MPGIQIQQVLAKANSGQPEAQFLLSQVCLQNRDTSGMIHWLQQASNNGFAAALDALGHCYEKGQGVSRDLKLALEHYERAIAGGSELAAFHKAELLYKSRSGPQNVDLIHELLCRAAAANVIPALRTLGYLAMQETSGRQLALDCFRRAAAGGDVVASFNLGWCLLQGWGGDGCGAEAAHGLRRAAAARYPFAESLLQQVADAQPSSRPYPLTGPLQIDADFPLYPAAQNVVKEALSEDPGITLHKDVLSIVDCAYLMFLAMPRLQRAHVIDPEGGKDGMVSTVRTNLSTYLPFTVVDLVGRYIELKIIGATGEQLERSEPMSILRYAPGEFYKPHVDYFDPNLPTSRELLEDGGQRTASAVTYLVAPTAGGGTSFPKLKLAVPAATGNTLWFRNCHDDGSIDARSLHAGDTVENGEKWVVTKWFRERPTRYIES